VMYRDGLGVPKNDAKALYWYRKEAEQSISTSQYKLAVMYAEGEGVPQDDAKAFYWLPWRPRRE